MIQDPKKFWSFVITLVAFVITYFIIIVKSFGKYFIYVHIKLTLRPSINITAIHFIFSFLNHQKGIFAAFKIS